MPYKIDVSEEDGGVITSYSGMLTAEEFEQCGKDKFLLNDKLLPEEAILSHRYSISDFSAVTDTDIPLNALLDNAAKTKAIMAVHPTGVMAVVAPRDLEFGLGRMWKAYTENHDDRIQVFKTRLEAEEWVSKSLEQLESSR